MLGRNSEDTILHLQDQRDRVAEMQAALYHAQEVFGTIARGDLPENFVRAVSYLAGQGLEHLANGSGELASLFADRALWDMQEQCRGQDRDSGKDQGNDWVIIPTLETRAARRTRTREAGNADHA